MRPRISTSFAVSWRLAGGLVLALAACSDTVDYDSRLIHRPLGMAVTCADAAGIPVTLDRCADDGVTRTGWVLDGDESGLAVLDLDSGRHLDADPFLPGFNALPVGGLPLAVRGTTDSRHLVVALARDDAMGLPSLLLGDPATVADGAPFLRQALPCDPIDLAIGRAAVPGEPDPGVPVILVLMACPTGARLAAVEFEGFGTLDASNPLALPGWSVPGTPVSVGVAADGTSAYVASALARPDELAGLPAGDVLTRLDLLAADGALGARVSVALGDPGMLGTYSHGTPDAARCEEAVGAGTNRWPPTRVRGAAAVSPDGGTVYVPMGEPAGIAVFTGDLDRIDVNAEGTGAEDGPSLLAHLGFPDIPLSSPAVSIAFVEIEAGVRALVATEAGEVIRVVVAPDEEHPVAHVLEGAKDQGESAASSPDLRFDGEWIPSAYLTRPDLASFGSTEVVPQAERDGLHRYYGIEFHADPREVVTESWTVTYEGTIPGTRRCGLLEVADGRVVLRDDAADFCALGVRADDDQGPGDLVVLRPTMPVACGGGVFGSSLEYRVFHASPSRLEMAPAFVSLPLPPDGCLTGPVPYEVRVNGAWAVVGSRSGFLHGRGTVDGVCADLPDATGPWNGRAFSPTPRQPSGRVTACPIREGDPEFDADSWEAALFENPMFRLRVVPGCRLGADFLPEVTAAIRDTALSFRVTSGFLPLSASLSGLPAPGIAVAGDRAFVADAAFGLVYEVDVEGMSVVSSRY